MIKFQICTHERHPIPWSVCRELCGENWPRDIESALVHNVTGTWFSHKQIHFQHSAPKHHHQLTILTVNISSAPVSDGNTQCRQANSPRAGLKQSTCWLWMYVAGDAQRAAYIAVWGGYFSGHICHFVITSSLSIVTLYVSISTT